MTGTPSKDRAEAHASKAKDVFRDYLKRIAYDRRACFEHDELLQELVAEALATSFAEGMKRAAEIARENARRRRDNANDKAQFNKFERRDFESMSMAGVQIAHAINSEISGAK